MLLSSQLDIAVILNNFFFNTDLVTESQEVLYGFPCYGMCRDALWCFLNQVSFKKLWS